MKAVRLLLIAAAAVLPLAAQSNSYLIYDGTTESTSRGGTPGTNAAGILVRYPANQYLGALDVVGATYILQDQDYRTADPCTFVVRGHDQLVAAGLDALRTGGVFGTGLGEGSAHLGFVPKIHNDFIVAAVGEQLGLVGVLLLVAGYVFLFHAGWRIAESAKHRASYVIAFGVSLCIAMQAIFNLCVATGLVRPKGINLPFVSYGGSSLLVLGASVGLLLAVARENDAPAAVPAAELDELGMADERATGPTSLGGAAS